MGVDIWDRERLAVWGVLHVTYFIFMYIYKVKNIAGIAIGFEVGVVGMEGAKK